MKKSKYYQLIFGILPIVFASSSLMAQSSKQNMSYRDVSLGITLEDFKKLNYKNILRSSLQESEVMCTHEDQVTDSMVKMRIMPKRFENDLNIINCVYVNGTGMPGRTQDVSEISIGDSGTSDYLFKFLKKEGSKNYILYKIELMFPARLHEDAEKSLTNRYGSPKDSKIIKIWQTSTSMASLVNMWNVNNSAALAYTLKDADSYVTNMVKKLESKNANKF